MVDLFRNPTKPVDNWGAVLKPYDTEEDNNRHAERAAHMVVVDSRNRNRTRYPSANNFRVQLLHPVRGVYSVELLSAIIPIPQDGMGNPIVTERYVTIASPELALMEPAQATNGDQTAFALGSPYYSPSGDQAFAEIPLIPNFPLAYTGGNASDAETTQATHWRKSECRVIKRFFPFKSELRYLDLSLVLRNNFTGTLPYPLADESTDPVDPTDPELNVLYIFEIVAKT